ncbi:MAG: YfcE family phosphodiesterase [Candidatus Thorarchaeota archaeon]
MQRILVFGDTHIPTRCDSIPKPFHKHIEQTRYDFALITGDLVREHSMRAVLPPLPRCYIVRGNMDYMNDYNFHEQVQAEEFKILLMHGTQLRPRGNIDQLWEVVVEIDADIGVHGHTHRPDIRLLKDKLLLNPGTITGATGGSSGRDDASFIELEVLGNSLKVILHHTDWRIAKKSEISFTKQEGIIRNNSL